MAMLQIIAILCWIVFGLFNLCSPKIDKFQYSIVWVCYVGTLLLLALEVM